MAIIYFPKESGLLRVSCPIAWLYTHYPRVGLGPQSMNKVETAALKTAGFLKVELIEKGRSPINTDCQISNFGCTRPSTWVCSTN
jgi:hypothetical protein